MIYQVNEKSTVIRKKNGQSHNPQLAGEESQQWTPQCSGIAQEAYVFYEYCRWKPKTLHEKYIHITAIFKVRNFC